VPETAVLAVAKQTIDVEMTMQLVTTCAEIRNLVAETRKAKRSLGLVPTMGALHEGHLSLVRASRTVCDWTIVTIFVNPAQFGPSEDFDRYPRSLEADLAALDACGVDAVFAPPSSEIYPDGFSTYVEPPRVASTLEGQLRPGHFRGVATIVLKLFHLIPAEAAFFGQKDYQQYLVIRQMARDLDVPIDVRLCPTVREPDGLAMSSRNRYLSPRERIQAAAISRSLQRAAQLVQQGERDAATITQAMRETLIEAGIGRIDYVVVADPQTLALVDRLEPPAVALVAAHVGTPRLIDNWMLVGPAGKAGRL
jgi:pantoate--beta-alanine ligase